MMMATSPQHRKAQLKLLTLVMKYYYVCDLEAFAPTPNNKYIYDVNDEEFTTKPYLLDVYASMPRFKDITTYDKIGIEVDGKKGHKTSKRQTIRDEQRTADLLLQYPDIKIFRFDTKALIGRGYVSPKTKRRHTIYKDDEILKVLGIKHPHI
jgi:hypothetical protein